MTRSEAWERLRYWLLRSLAARHRVAGAGYSCLAALVEARVHPTRAHVARERIARSLRVDRRLAQRIFHACLLSEAREEADTAWLRHSGAPLESLAQAPRSEPVRNGPCIYVSLHFGSPIITFLYLQSVRRIPIRAIGRPLDDGNPLSNAKRTWGKHKVAWISRYSGTTFIGVDGKGVIEAREELLAGRSLFAVIDVPADVVSRSTRLDLFGEQILVSNGVLRLAHLTGVPVVPVVGRRQGSRVQITFDRPILEASEIATVCAVNDWLLRTLEAHPNEWWLWPFVASDQA